MPSCAFCSWLKPWTLQEMERWWRTFGRLKMALNEGVAGSGFWHTCSCTRKTCWGVVVYVKWMLPIVQDVVQKRSKYQSCNCSVQLWIAVLSYIYIYIELNGFFFWTKATSRHKDTKIQPKLKSLFPESGDFFPHFFVDFVELFGVSAFHLQFQDTFWRWKGWKRQLEVGQSGSRGSRHHFDSYSSKIWGREQKKQK